MQLEAIKKSKKRIQTCFSRAAKHYDQHAFFQQKVANQLMDLLLNGLASPQPLSVGGGDFRILDLGCGSGYSFADLKTLYPEASVIGLDLSLSQCLQASMKNSAEVLCADFDALPFPDQSFDLVFSSLTLQWSLSFQDSLKAIARILKPQGILIFSTLTEGSLKELQEAKAGAGRFHPLSYHFLSFEENLSSLHALGFEVFSSQSCSEKYSFDSPIEVMRNLKNVGANYSSTWELGLSTKQSLMKIQAAYKRDPSTQQYPLTYQVAYFVGKKRKLRWNN